MSEEEVIDMAREHGIDATRISTVLGFAAAIERSAIERAAYLVTAEDPRYSDWLYDDRELLAAAIRALAAAPISPSANVAQGAEAICDHEWEPMTKPHKECVKCGDVRLDTAPPAQTALTDDARDAERYRWLRDPNTDVAKVIDKVTGEVAYDEGTRTGGYPIYEYRSGDDLDAAIDAAMTAAQSGDKS